MLPWRNFASRDPSESLKYDAIVIGAGPGGMSCAALLGRYGKRVCVLEQHDTAGGSMHHFKQGTEWVSAGWHYVGKPSLIQNALWSDLTNDQPYTIDTADTPIDTLLGKEGPIGSLTAATYAKVLTLPLDALRRVSSYTVFYAMVKCLPSFLARPLWFYFRISGKYAEATMPYTDWCRKYTSEPIDPTAPDREMWWVHQGDHGMAREKTIAIVHCPVAEHYARGTMHPEGGVFETVKRICKTIVSRGGSVFVKAPVAEILLRDGVVQGVSLDDGTVISAPSVVVSGAYAAAKLLGEKNVPPSLKLALSLGPSVGHGAVFLTYTGKTPTDLGLPQGITWLLDERLFLGAKTSPTGTVLYVLFDMPYVARGASYESKKERLTEEALAAVFRRWPLLETTEHETDSGTPATTEHYLASWRGCSYGLSQEPLRFTSYDHVRALKPKVDGIQGLFITGQDVICSGVVGAFMGGIFAAQVVQFPGWRGLVNFVISDLIKTYLKRKAELKKEKKTA